MDCIQSMDLEKCNIRRACLEVLLCVQSLISIMQAVSGQFGSLCSSLVLYLLKRENCNIGGEGNVTNPRPPKMGHKKDISLNI